MLLQGTELKPAIVLVQGEGPDSGLRQGYDRARDGERYRCIPCAGLSEAIRKLEGRHGADAPLALIAVTLDYDPQAALRFLSQIGHTHPLALRAVVTSPGTHAQATAALRDGHIDRVIPHDASNDDKTRAIDALLSRYEALVRLCEEAPGRLGKHILITGATGFLGKCLLADLLCCGNAKITVLCRGARNTSYDCRLPFTAEDFPGRLEFIEGDVTLPRLGMTDGQWARATESVDEIWHLAAVTSFRETLRRQIMDVNVEGTRSMLAFAAACPRLTCFNHVSSAYVAGRRAKSEVIPEVLAAEPPEFNNIYEESKFLAERLVAQSGLPHLVYRPSIIFGESYSGRSDGKTVYGVIRALLVAQRLAKRHNGHSNGASASVRIVAEGAASLNLLPIDWVVDTMISLRAQAKPAGTVFHIAHTRATTMNELQQAATSALDIRDVQFDSQLAQEEMSPLESLFHRQAGPFIQYMLSQDPTFDTRNAEALLGPSDYPELDLEFLSFALRSYAELTGAPGELERIS